MIYCHLYSAKLAVKRTSSDMKPATLEKYHPAKVAKREDVEEATHVSHIGLASPYPNEKEVPGSDVNAIFSCIVF